MRSLNQLWAAIALSALAVAPAAAQQQPSQSSQIQTVDPNAAIDSDLGPRQTTPPPVSNEPEPLQDENTSAPPAQQQRYAPPPPAAPVQQSQANGATYSQDDVLAGAEGVFGKGAKGLADIIQKILKDQGEPNAYIAGREAGAALVVGVRYGSGMMSHKVEGDRKVYWTGPSVGFDVGGDANKVFVLVYNLYDSQDLYKRFPAAEGHVYFVGGFSATYLRRGDVVLIPVHLGVGWRLGANVGYMKFTEKSRILPF